MMEGKRAPWQFQKGLEMLPYLVGEVSSNASWLDMTQRLLGRNIPSEAPLTP
jgi:hypothetical protein